MFMTPNANSAKFWLIVEACLVELYGLASDAASREVERLTHRNAKGATLGEARDMAYHAQPLHVASNIAGEDKPMSDATWRAYQSILGRFEANPIPDVEARKENSASVIGRDNGRPRKLVASH